MGQSVTAGMATPSFPMTLVDKLSQWIVDSELKGA